MPFDPQKEQYFNILHLNRVVDREDQKEEVEDALRMIYGKSIEIDWPTSWKVWVWRSKEEE